MLEEYRGTNVTSVAVLPPQDGKLIRQFAQDLMSGHYSGPNTVGNMGRIFLYGRARD